MDSSTRLAAGYTRVSTGRQAREGVSLDAQEDAIRRLCELKGLSLEWFFIEPGMSGRRADNRPSLQEALDWACENKAVLVVYSLSRLARSTVDFDRILRRLTDAGAGLVSISEDLNTTTAMGRAIAKIIAVMAELESEQTGERVRMSIAHKREEDGLYFGQVPWGHKIGKYGNLIQDSREQRWVGRMVEHHTMLDWSPGDIAEWLNKSGVKAKMGGAWTTSSVRRVLERALGKGNLRDCRTKLTDAKKKKIRELYATGDYSMRRLAIRFKVDKSRISRVVCDGKMSP